MGRKDVDTPSGALGCDSEAGRLKIVSGSVCVLSIIALIATCVSVEDVDTLKSRGGTRLLLALLGTFSLSFVAAWKAEEASECGANASKVALQYAIALIMLYVYCSCI